MMRKTLMRELSNDTAIELEMKRVREEFLKSVNVKVLDGSDKISSFSAIISTKGPIVIE